jgi:hypothetical protein
MNRPRLSHRGVLAAVWLAGFCLSFSIVYFLHLTHHINSDQNYALAISQLKTAFVPFLLIVLTFYFSDKRHEPLREPNGAFVVAFLVSAFWNIVVASPLIWVMAGKDTIEAAIRNIQTTSNVLSFIVGPAIGFYFGARHVEQGRE